MGKGLNLKKDIKEMFYDFFFQFYLRPNFSINSNVSSAFEVIINFDTNSLLAVDTLAQKHCLQNHIYRLENGNVEGTAMKFNNPEIRIYNLDFGCCPNVWSE